MNLKELEKIDKVQNSLHNLAPYIGRVRPELASYLIKEYSSAEGIIYDPFCGSGTILLEGWSAGRAVFGTDLNCYAYTLSLGKLYPYETQAAAIEKLELYQAKVKRRSIKTNLESAPEWVRSFYHPQTLKEIMSWMYYLRKNKEWFLLSCLLGILHHQRPGFLSYPSSHGAPYLRSAKYPKNVYPQMYEYKSVYEKLSAKVNRTYKKIPVLNYDIQRSIEKKDASRCILPIKRVETIITSPPYMKSLTYARDNRLRLWFLGESDWASLDKKISPCKTDFISMMRRCFNKWARIQACGDKCVIIIGDINVGHNGQKMSLGDVMVELSQKRYKLVEAYQDPIPEAHKFVKGNTSIKKEIIVVLERV